VKLRQKRRSAPRVTATSWLRSAPVRIRFSDSRLPALSDTSKGASQSRSRCSRCCSHRPHSSASAASASASVPAGDGRCLGHLGSATVGTLFAEGAQPAAQAEALGVGVVARTPASAPPQIQIELMAFWPRISRCSLSDSANHCICTSFCSLRQASSPDLPASRCRRCARWRPMAWKCAGRPRRRPG
jgi:hypothetical protein